MNNEERVVVDSAELDRMHRFIDDFRQSQANEHRDIITMLANIKTQVSVCEANLAHLSDWMVEHKEDHRRQATAQVGYIITFIVLGIGVCVEISLTLFG